MIIIPLIAITILLTVFYGCKKIKRKKVLLKQMEHLLESSRHSIDMQGYSVKKLYIKHEITSIKLTMYFIISLSVSFLVALFCLYMWYI